MIVDAARAEFLEHGYNDATIRAIARRARVDPALIYHYFGDKPTLYAATLDLPEDPRQIQDDVRASSQTGGSRLVELFMTQWETGPGEPGQRFVTLAQATVSSPEAARGVREFLFDRVWSRGEGAAEDAGWRRTAVSSLLLGMGWNRYVLRTEPIASAPIADIAAWFGPVIEGIMRGSGLGGQ
jgi:AcrR family transcriptional regulator